VSWLKLSRRGIIYVKGKPASKGRRLVLRFRPPLPLRQGRYMLTIIHRGSFTSRTTRQTVVLGG
jgi:hypothetical protein